MATRLMPARRRWSVAAYRRGMVTPRQVREIALGLPETTEQDHHGRPSFRVRGKIFATLFGSGVMNVMPGEERILAAVAEAPEACREFYWGGRLRAVQVQLEAAHAEFVADLLHFAWSQRAP